MKRSYTGTTTSLAKRYKSSTPSKVYTGYAKSSLGSRYKSVSKVGKYVPRNIGAEVKALDTVNPTNASTVAPFTFNTTTLFVPLNAVSPGSGPYNRVGRRFCMKSLYIQGYWNYTANTTVVPNTPQLARMMVVYDKQANGANFTLSDLLKSQNNSSGGDVSTSTISDQFNLNNRNRFEIIVDKKFFLPSLDTAAGNVSGGITYSPSIIPVSIFHKLGNRQTQFKSDNVPSTIADIATGSLTLVCFGNLASGSDSWSFTGSLRVKYVDT